MNHGEGVKLTKIIIVITNYIIQVIIYSNTKKNDSVTKEKPDKFVLRKSGGLKE